MLFWDIRVVHSAYRAHGPRSEIPKIPSIGRTSRLVCSSGRSPAQSRAEPNRIGRTARKTTIFRCQIRRRRAAAGCSGVFGRCPHDWRRSNPHSSRAYAKADLKTSAVAGKRAIRLLTFRSTSVALGACVRPGERHGPHRNRSSNQDLYSRDLNPPGNVDGRCQSRIRMCWRRQRLFTRAYGWRFSRPTSQKPFSKVIRAQAFALGITPKRCRSHCPINNENWGLNS